MRRVKSRLTVFFEDPFWVGLYEREDGGSYEVCRVVFGAEPKDKENSNGVPDLKKGKSRRGRRVMSFARKSAGRNTRAAERRSFFAHNCGFTTEKLCFSAL